MTKPTVMIVDDDRDVIAGVSHYLRRRYKLESTTRGSDAARLSEQVAPDLVLVDYYLSDTTGDRVIAEIRKQRPSIPIILMSGSVDSRLAEELVFGASDFISKPFQQETLIAKIERQLEAQAQRRAAERDRKELIALYERRDDEARSARAVLDQMLSRGSFDPAVVRYTVRASDQFAGDFVFGASVGERYRWMLGDVSGHTLASALVTIPLSMMFYATARRAVPLAESIQTMDTELAALLPVGMYCAAAVCELDRTTGELQVWNAGLPDLLVRAPSAVITRLPSTDTPLGVDRARTTPFAINRLAVEQKSRIYTLSDGLIEVPGANDNLLGIDAVIDTLLTNAPAEAFDAVLTTWSRHVMNGETADDISMIEVVV